jgi:cytosine/adenosine deaminase-related metal-dependent hydrolase
MAQLSLFLLCNYTSATVQHDNGNGDGNDNDNININNNNMNINMNHGQSLHRPPPGEENHNHKQRHHNHKQRQHYSIHFVDGHHDDSDNNNDSSSAGTTKILLKEFNYHYYNDDDFLHHNEDDLNHQVKDGQPNDSTNRNNHDNVRRAPSTNKRDEPVSQQAEERDDNETTNTSKMIHNKKVTFCNDSVFDEETVEEDNDNNDNNVVECYKAIRGNVLHFISDPYQSNNDSQEQAYDYADHVEYVPDGLLIMKRRTVTVSSTTTSNSNSTASKATPLRYKHLRHSYVIDRIVPYAEFVQSVRSMSMSPSNNVNTNATINTIKPDNLLNFQIDDVRPGIVMPGFLDLHVHATQENVVASYGASLLPWLAKYVLPEEDNLSSNQDYAKIMMRLFVRDCLRAGTTTPVAYTTYNETVPHSLFEEAEKLNIAIITGAQGQDWYNPDDNFVEATHTLYNKWHNRGRAKCGVTIRFAPGSSYTQLQQASKLLDTYPDAYFMTHLGETYDEVHMASLLYQPNGIPQGLPLTDVNEQPGLGLEPNATYTQLYDYFNLLRPNRTIMGHSIHLSPEDWILLSQKHVSVAHCPTSNNFFGSGLFNVGAAVRAGVKFGVGSDVGAGTHLCTLNTLGAMYEVAMLGNAWQAGIVQQWDVHGGVMDPPPEVCVTTFCPTPDENDNYCSLENDNLTRKAFEDLQHNRTRLCYNHNTPHSAGINYQHHQTTKRPDAGVPPNHVHIHPALAFYSATLGAARALRLEDRIGSFQRGSDADVVVLNPFGSYDTARRTGVIDSTSSSGADDGASGGGDASLDYLWKRLFILMTAGHAGGAGGVGVGAGARMGSRGGAGAGAGGNIAATYIAGHALYVNVNMPLTKDMEMKATTEKSDTGKKNGRVNDNGIHNDNANTANASTSSILHCVLPTNPQFPKDHMKVAECAAALAMSSPSMELLQQEEEENEQEDDHDQHEDQAQASAHDVQDL